MYEIVTILIIAAAYIVLFHEDYNWAVKVKTWYQNTLLKLRS